MKKEQGQAFHVIDGHRNDARERKKICGLLV